MYYYYTVPTYLGTPKVKSTSMYVVCCTATELGPYRVPAKADEWTGIDSDRGLIGWKPGTVPNWLSVSKDMGPCICFQLPTAIPSQLIHSSTLY